MNQLALILIVSWLAGFTAFIGGVIAKFEGTAETEGKRKLVHSVVAFGGGILYIVFQDIAPQSKMERRWSSPLGAVLGFIVGMVGKQLLG